MLDLSLASVPRWVRPVRIPERIALSRAEPEIATAGEYGSWRLPLRLAEAVPAGTTLRLQISASRNNGVKFVAPQVERPGDEGYVTLRAEDCTPMPLLPSTLPQTFNAVAPAGGLRAGSVLSATLGDRDGGGPGLKAPTLRALSKPIILYRADDPDYFPRHWNDETQPAILAACVLHILGGPLDRLRAHAPSQAVAGEPLELLVRPEDAFDNLAQQAVDIAVSLDGAEVPAEVVPVAESCAVTLRVVAPPPGVHRFTVRDRLTGKAAVTNPVVCHAALPERLALWGMIHGHTEMSDGVGNIDYYFRQMRDEAALDFAAPGDHDHLAETSEAMWRMICEAVKRWHAPGRFVTFLGYEFAKWRKVGEGDRNVYYLEDDRPLYRSDAGHYPMPPDLFRALAGETALVIPHHTGHAGSFCDWQDHDPVCERLVEIYQVRGSYECAAEDDNPLAEQGSEPVAVGFVRNALALGWRVGFTAGGDDHTGQAGLEYQLPKEFAPYKAGLTCVFATARTREALWEALWNRRVTATSGPRILLNWELDGHPLGAELDLADWPELARRRRLRVTCHGAAPLARVEIIRSNRVVHSVAVEGLDAEVAWDDESPLEDALLSPAKFRDHPFCFYYVRALQHDGEMAWASPIWIDVNAGYPASG